MKFIFLLLFPSCLIAMRSNEDVILTLESQNRAYSLLLENESSLRLQKSTSRHNRIRARIRVFYPDQSPSDEELETDFLNSFEWDEEKQEFLLREENSLIPFCDENSMLWIRFYSRQIRVLAPEPLTYCIYEIRVF